MLVHNGKQLPVEVMFPPLSTVHQTRDSDTLPKLSVLHIDSCAPTSTLKLPNVVHLFLERVWAEMEFYSGPVIFKSRELHSNRHVDVSTCYKR